MIITNAILKHLQHGQSLILFCNLKDINNAKTVWRIPRSLCFIEKEFASNELLLYRSADRENDPRVTEGLMSLATRDVIIAEFAELDYASICLNLFIQTRLRTILQEFPLGNNQMLQLSCVKLFINGDLKVVVEQDYQQF